MSNKHEYEASVAAEYGETDQLQYGRSNGSSKPRRPAFGSKRTGSGPKSFNGMHRRRRRKMTW